MSRFARVWILISVFFCFSNVSFGLDNKEAPAISSVSPDNQQLALEKVEGFDGGFSLQGKDPVVRYVSNSGSDTIGDGSVGNPYATIQHAILNSVDGDEVCVQPGTYTGPGNRDIDFLNKAITVRSLNNDPAECIIDCQGSDVDPHRGFIFQSDEGTGSVLSGFTITNGFVPNSSGGGILLDGDPYGGDDGASPNIRWCNVINNHGGGVNVRGTLANPYFADCQFNDNVGFGFGIHFGSGVGGFSRCEFSNNSNVGIECQYVVQTNFTDCEFLQNGSAGFTGWEEISFEMTRCLFVGNGGAGIKLSGSEFSSLLIQESVLSNNTGAGIDSWGAWFRIEILDSEIINNGSHGLSMGAFPSSGHQVDNCRIVGNGDLGIEFSPWVGMKREIFETRTPSFLISNSEIGLNDGGGIGGGFPTESRSTISSTLVYDNRGDGINLDISESNGWTPHLLVKGSTIVKNDGVGIFADVDSLTLDNVLVAENGLQAVELGMVGYIASTCSDLFANSGGDWTGPLAGFLGQDGNISLDPNFCGDNNTLDPYTISEESPCAAENNVECGQIGARGVGCSNAPVLESVSDVGNDQGRQVRLVWRNCGYDQAGSAIVITEYGIYRLQDSFKSGDGQGRAGDKLADWDFITTVPARRDTLYQVVAPTLCDSTISEGLCLSTFMVSAMTADPGTYFDSDAVAGYSLDNLHPVEPQNLAVDYSHDRNVLTWGLPSDDDFSHFLVYRTLQSEDDPGWISEPLALVVDSTWTDIISGEDQNPWDYRYWLVAVDWAGNRSEIVGQTLVSSIGEPRIPVRTELHAAVPNPFNPRTAISFDLTKAANVDLRVYDISGRMIKSLISGQTRTAGRHDVTWMGRDDSGRKVAAGLYFFRFKAGDFVQTRRMTLMK